MNSLKAFEAQTNYFTGICLRFLPLNVYIPFCIFTCSCHCLGGIPKEMTNLTNLKYLDIRHNNMSGRLPDEFCDMYQLTFVYTSYPICYPYCLSRVINDYSSSPPLLIVEKQPKASFRCQSNIDIALCDLSRSVTIQNYINCTTYVQSGIFEMSSNHPATPNTGIYSQNASIKVDNNQYFKLSFDQHTDYVGKPLVFCSSSTCLNVFANYSDQPTSNFPGIGSNPALTINGDQFFINYTLHSIESLDEINWGFKIVADSYQFLTGWQCTSPPLNGSLYSESDPYCQSFAGNFSSWHGLTLNDFLLESVSFNSFGLFGEIHSTIQYLNGIDTLDFSSNSLSGEIPTQLGLLTSLTSLRLGSNFFSGNLSFIPTLTNLVSLDVSLNHYRGPLPLNLIVGLSDSLTTCNFRGNSFTGEISPALCTLASDLVIDVSGNPLACYPPCAANSYNYIFGAIPECHPTNSPTNYPSLSPVTLYPSESILSDVKASTFLTLPTIIGVAVGGPIIILCLCFILFAMCRRGGDERKRRKALQKLPIHSAVLQHVHDVDTIIRVSYFHMFPFIYEFLTNDLYLQLIKTYPDTIVLQDYDKQTAFDLLASKFKFHNPIDHTRIFTELVTEVLPVHPVEKKVQLPEYHGYIWLRVVQSDKYAEVVAQICDRYPDMIFQLAYSEDTENRPAINIASSLCQAVLKQSLNFLKRYEFITPTNNPHHKSPTCMVLIAVDHKSNGIRVALKFMRNKAQFMTELSVRQNGTFYDAYVISIIQSFDSGRDTFYEKDCVWKGLSEFPYCVVMPAAERNLGAIISSENIAGKDWLQVKSIAQNLAEALRHMHKKGFIHGDVKPLNCMRMDGRLKLIDLDARYTLLLL
jgi:Leucine-rich repeat (LRR) protein